MVPIRILTDIKDIDMEGLLTVQKEIALKFLSEETDAFAKDDNDIGCIPDLELDLDYQTPLQYRRTM